MPFQTYDLPTAYCLLPTSYFLLPHWEKKRANPGEPLIISWGTAPDQPFTVSSGALVSGAYVVYSACAEDRATYGPGAHAGMIRKSQ